MEQEEVLLIVPQAYMGGKIFCEGNYQRSEEISKPLRVLKKNLAELGYAVKTVDQSENIEGAKAIIFFEVPPKGSPWYRLCDNPKLDGKRFLLVGEPPATVKDNHDKKKHYPFTRILTFNDSLIDDERYFRTDFTLPIRKGQEIKIPRRPFSSKKMLCLISSNKFSSHKDELYGERIRAIRFMERHHPNDFDLYGVGWEKPMIHTRWASALKLNGAIWRFWPKSVKASMFPSYRGSPQDKKMVLPSYLFTIAYENCMTLGYISEKILEAMLYGCVPVYLGDPNIEKRIPKDCFIDKRDYEGYYELYEFMSNMSETEHEGYLDRIEEFLNSDKIYPFSIDCFVERIQKILDL